MRIILIQTDNLMSDMKINLMKLQKRRRGEKRTQNMEKVMN